MSRINRVLVLIFVILIVITLFELGYYFFYVSKPNHNLRSQQNPIEKIKTDDFDYLANLFKEELSPQETTFFRNLFTLNYKDKSYRSLILTKELQGKIVNITNQPDQFSPIFQYQIKFEIEIENRPKPLTIYYTKEELLRVKVIKKDKDQEKNIDFANLRTGDNVFIKETYDLKNFKLIEATIAKSG